MIGLPFWMIVTTLIYNELSPVAHILYILAVYMMYVFINMV